MAQTVLITLTTAGADTGPFNLYSNIDGFAVPFENNVAKGDLEAGYVSFLVPDSTTTIRVQSDNPLCDNFIDLVLPTTTTTTTTSTPSTTTTTTVPGTTTSTTTGLPQFIATIYAHLEDTLSSGSAEVQSSLTNNGVDWTIVGSAFSDLTCSSRGTVINIPSGSTLYLRVRIAGVPVEFGVANSSVCPASASLCITSSTILANVDRSITVRIVGNAGVPC